MASGLRVSLALSGFIMIWLISACTPVITGGAGDSPGDVSSDDDAANDTGSTEDAGLCGNGELEAGEECDDGNTASGDGCDRDCQEEESEMTTDDQDTQTQTRVLLETSMGNIVIELEDQTTPLAVENFLQYVDDGFYDGRDGRGAAIFHRVIPNFVIQGGGLTADCSEKTPRDPIQNEAAAAASNVRGTLSMAQTNVPNSGTSQFFINLGNNTNLDFIEGQFQGHAVFGRVVEGMDVVDAIAAVETGNCPPPNSAFTDVPVTPVVINAAGRTTTP